MEHIAIYKLSKTQPSLLSKVSDRLCCGDMDSAVYFYHSDHLGSASWITNGSGNPVQHLQYMPYGEPFVNERTSSYNERFTFTGKERDSETGYSYFGARFYDSDLMTGWLSVDPLSDSIPYASPYIYCLNNPIKLKDPNGEIPILPIIWAVYEIGTSIYDAYETANTITDPNTSKSEKIAAGVGFLAGLALPGGGYSKIFKEGTKLSEKTIKAFEATSAKISSRIKNKSMQNMANKLLKYSKDGNLPTPNTDKEQFTQIRGTNNWIHEKTGAIYSKSKTNHKGKDGEYKIFSPGTENKLKNEISAGKRITVSLKGEILGN